MVLSPMSFSDPSSPFRAYHCYPTSEVPSLTWTNSLLTGLLVDRLASLCFALSRATRMIHLIHESDSVPLWSSVVSWNLYEEVQLPLLACPASGTLSCLLLRPWLLPLGLQQKQHSTGSSSPHAPRSPSVLCVCF